MRRSGSRRATGWPRALAWAAGSGALLLVTGMAAQACGSGSGVLTCGQIPDDGCPLGRGGTCDDAVCAGLYDCVDGHWQLVESCPGFGDGGSGAGASGGSGAGGQGGAGAEAGAGGCEPFIFDHSGETTGCTPELVVPDCTMGAAETCHPCLTGCLDFFMCMADGWAWMAYCDDDGQLQIEP